MLALGDDAAARVAAYLASRLDPEREEDPVKHSRRTDDADRRAALAALSVPCTRHQLASRLRWTQRRADDVLADLARAGLVVCQRMRQSTTGPLEDVWRVCAPADA